jgi:ribosomal protein L40E
VLRALKDLELEHSVGKIDDQDYAEISGSYREQAKGILREMDVAVEPLRPKAEEIAATYLKKKGLGSRDNKRGKRAEPIPTASPESDATEAPERTRLDCPRCTTSNEPDATFCKKCGAKLTRVTCGTCATSNEPDATFCKKCGAALGAATPEAEDA